jgi:hypothetical protein
MLFFAMSVMTGIDALSNRFEGEGTLKESMVMLPLM